MYEILGQCLEIKKQNYKIYKANSFFGVFFQNKNIPFLTTTLFWQSNKLHKGCRSNGTKKLKELKRFPNCLFPNFTTFSEAKIF